MKTTSRKKTYRRGPTSEKAKNRPAPPLPPGAGVNAHSRGQTNQGRITPKPGRGIGDNRQKGKAERLITSGILAASLSIVISLSVYFRPFLAANVFPVVKTFCSNTVDTVAGTVTGFMDRFAKKEEEPENSQLALESAPAQETGEELAYMDRNTEMGDISDMGAEPVYPVQEDAIYSCMLDTALGPLVYYNQGDVRWKEYLYGGYDRLAKYGCGPVCVSMLINSFTSTCVSPIEMADWSAANGYYARQGGSYHGLIPGSLSAFGLQVDSVTDRTADNVRSLLESGHVLVALMGRGALTQNGHFIIIAQLSPSGNVYIADPASYENSTKEWDLELLMRELKKSYDSGGPLWAVSLGENFPAGSDLTP